MSGEVRSTSLANEMDEETFENVYGRSLVRSSKGITLPLNRSFRSVRKNGGFGLAMNEERKLQTTVRINEPAQRGSPCVPTRPRSGGLTFIGRTVSGRGNC